MEKIYHKLYRDAKAFIKKNAFMKFTVKKSSYIRDKHIRY